MLISTDGVIRGNIEPISATIRQEINGEYSCNVEIALSDDLAEYFDIDAIVYLNDANGTVQQFRLERPERTLTSLTAFGWHITQDLAHDIIVHKKYTNAEGATVWADLLQSGISETRFTGTADSSAINSLTIVRQSILNALIGDQDNSYLSRWGGEIERNNFTVNMKTQLGENRNYRVAYKKNLTGIHVTVDNSTVVNRIVPTYLNENDAATLLPEIYIDSAHISDTAVPHTAAIHFGDIRIGEEIDGVVLYPDAESAEAEVRTRVDDLYASGIDIAMLTVDIEFVQLRNTIEYADYAALEIVRLGDVIGAEYEDYSWTSRVVAYDWDAVLQRYNKLTIGNVRPSASDMNDSIVDAATTAANAALTRRTVELTGAIASAQTTADGKNTVYYSSTEPTGGTYIENDLWFDTDDSNKMFIHDGSVWNPVQFGENAIADLAITNAKIADATIQNAKIANLDAGKVTTGVLNAARVAIGSGTSFDTGYDPTLIKVGGRNLLKDSDKDVTGSGYILASYDWANVSDIVQGEQYTITIEGTLPAGLSWYINVYAQNPTGYPALATLNDSNKVSANKWVKTVTMPTLASGQTFTGKTSLYQYPLDSGQSVSVTRIKIEKGNKATDWSPAPEDLIHEGATYQGVSITAADGFVSEATIAGKDASLTINATKGIEYLFDGKKRFGVDDNGYVYANRIYDPDDPYAYAQVGKDPDTSGASMLTLYSPSGSTTPRRKIKFSTYGTTAATIEAFVRKKPGDVDGVAMFTIAHGSARVNLWGSTDGVSGQASIGAGAAAGNRISDVIANNNEIVLQHRFSASYADMNTFRVDDEGLSYDQYRDATETTKTFKIPEIQTGTITLNDTTGVSVTFANEFTATPRVVLTAQTSKSGVITAKVTAKSTTGFTAIIGGTVSGNIAFDWIAMSGATE